MNFKPIEELHELLKAPEAALAKAHSCLHQDIVLDQNHGEAGHELCLQVIDVDFGPGDIQQVLPQSFPVEPSPIDNYNEDFLFF